MKPSQEQGEKLISSYITLAHEHLDKQSQDMQHFIDTDLKVKNITMNKKVSHNFFALPGYHVGSVALGYAGFVLAGLIGMLLADLLEPYGYSMGTEVC